MARWQSEGHRQRHFYEHGSEMDAATIDEYDAATDDTLDHGTYFGYWDDNTEQDRIGCFDRRTGRFVVLNVDDEVVSCFLTSERYVRSLPFSNYDDGDEH